MTSLEAALRGIRTDLTDAGVRFALVGGLAVSARTEPRISQTMRPMSEMNALLLPAS